jgi:hypothetical protein
VVSAVTLALPNRRTSSLAASRNPPEKRGGVEGQSRWLTKTGDYTNYSGGAAAGSCLGDCWCNRDIKPTTVRCICNENRKRELPASRDCRASVFPMGELGAS